MRLRTATLWVTALLLANSVQTSAFAQATIPVFKDIKGHWAERTIAAMVDRGILDGYPNGTFKPNDPVKVDQFIKMLVLSYTELHQDGERSWSTSFVQSLSAENQTILMQDYRYYDFKPVTAGYWAKPYIDVASDLHLLNKSRYSDFQGDMTRENVAEIVYYTLQETEFLEDSAFSQQTARSYGDLQSATERERKFIAEALVKGIMLGYPNGNFGVGDKVTRAEALAVLNRLTDKKQRIAVSAPTGGLQLSVPTAGGARTVTFPDQRMRDAYDVLKAAGTLRGANHDLLDTKLRLFKDKTEMDEVIAQPAGSAKPTEETTLWLDPQYDAYGITVRLRDGALARNQEAIDLFSNFLFGYDASTFRTLFADTTSKVAAGKPVSSSQTSIAGDAVQIIVDSTTKTVIFSVSKKK
ncbi:S-layer homology domain-containing protein [Cohnella panacarvi]|uniref:S-layer homology domain-containing protein n=1 Tax=Cohnella panacarvi TaxID=400776 RepID=UPI0004794C27|nr:S-layer homology domain-containing protein [Cohnella panacarvi]